MAMTEEESRQLWKDIVAKSGQLTSGATYDERVAMAQAQMQANPNLATEQGYIPLPNEPQPEASGGYLDSIIRSVISGGAGVAQGQAQAANVFGLGDGQIADYLNEVGQRNARKKDYTAGERIPFTSDYWTNPEGATYDVGNMLGSMAVLGAETALITSGIGEVAGLLGGGTTAAGAAGAAATAGTIGRIAGYMSKAAQARNLPKLAKVFDGTLGKLAAINILSSPIEALSEAGQAGQQALDEGADRDEAQKRALTVFGLQTPVLMISNALEDAGLAGLFTNEIGKAAGKKVGKGALQNTIQSIVFEAAQQGWEEGFQQSTQEYAAGQQSGLGIFNPFQWSEEAMEQASAGAVGGAVFGGTGTAIRAGKRRYDARSNAQAQAQTNANEADTTQQTEQPRRDGSSPREQAGDFITQTYQEASPNEKARMNEEITNARYQEDNGDTEAFMNLARKYGWQGEQEQQGNTVNANTPPEENQRVAEENVRNKEAALNRNGNLSNATRVINNGEQEGIEVPFRGQQMYGIPTLDTLEQSATNAAARQTIPNSEWQPWQSVNPDGRTFNPDVLRRSLPVKEFILHNPNAINVAQRAVTGDTEALRQFNQYEPINRGALIDILRNGGDDRPYKASNDQRKAINDSINKRRENARKNIAKRFYTQLDKGNEALPAEAIIAIKNALKNGTNQDIANIFNNYGDRLGVKASNKELTDLTTSNVPATDFTQQAQQQQPQTQQGVPQYQPVEPSMEQRNVVENTPVEPVVQEQPQQQQRKRGNQNVSNMRNIQADIDSARSDMQQVNDGLSNLENAISQLKALGQPTAELEAVLQNARAAANSRSEALNTLAGEAKKDKNKSTAKKEQKKKTPFFYLKAEEKAKIKTPFDGEVKKNNQNLSIPDVKRIGGKDFFNWLNRTQDWLKGDGKFLSGKRGLTAKAAQNCYREFVYNSDNAQEVQKTAAKPATKEENKSQTKPQPKQEQEKEEYAEDMLVGRNDVNRAFVKKYEVRTPEEVAQRLNDGEPFSYKNGSYTGRYLDSESVDGTWLQDYVIYHFVDGHYYDDERIPESEFRETRFTVDDVAEMFGEEEPQPKPQKRGKPTNAQRAQIKTPFDEFVNDDGSENISFNAAQQLLGSNFNAWAKWVGEDTGLRKYVPFFSGNPSNPTLNARIAKGMYSDFLYDTGRVDVEDTQKGKNKKGAKKNVNTTAEEQKVSTVSGNRESSNTLRGRSAQQNTEGNKHQGERQNQAAEQNKNEIKVNPFAEQLKLRPNGKIKMQEIAKMLGDNDSSFYYWAVNDIWQKSATPFDSFKKKDKLTDEQIKERGGDGFAEYLHNRQSQERTTRKTGLFTGEELKSLYKDYLHDSGKTLNKAFPDSEASVKTIKMMYDRYMKYRNKHGNVLSVSQLPSLLPSVKEISEQKDGNRIKNVIVIGDKRVVPDDYGIYPVPKWFFKLPVCEEQISAMQELNKETVKNVVPRIYKENFEDEIAKLDIDWDNPDTNSEAYKKAQQIAKDVRSDLTDIIYANKTSSAAISRFPQANKRVKWAIKNMYKPESRYGKGATKSEVTNIIGKYKKMINDIVPVVAIEKAEKQKKKADRARNKELVAEAKNKADKIRLLYRTDKLTAEQALAQIADIHREVEDTQKKEGIEIPLTENQIRQIGTLEQLERMKAQKDLASEENIAEDVTEEIEDMTSDEAFSQQNELIKVLAKTNYHSLDDKGKATYDRQRSFSRTPHDNATELQSHVIETADRFLTAKEKIDNAKEEDRLAKERVNSGDNVQAKDCYTIAAMNLKLKREDGGITRKVYPDLSDKALADDNNWLGINPENDKNLNFPYQIDSGIRKNIYLAMKTTASGKNNLEVIKGLPKDITLKRFRMDTRQAFERKAINNWRTEKATKEKTDNDWIDDFVDALGVSDIQRENTTKALRAYARGINAVFDRAKELDMYGAERERDSAKAELDTLNEEVKRAEAAKKTETDLLKQREKEAKQASKKEADALKKAKKQKQAEKPKTVKGQLAQAEKAEEALYSAKEDETPVQPMSADDVKDLAELNKVHNEETQKEADKRAKENPFDRFIAKNRKANELVLIRPSAVKGLGGEDFVNFLQKVDHDYKYKENLDALKIRDLYERFKSGESAEAEEEAAEPVEAAKGAEELSANEGKKPQPQQKKNKGKVTDNKVENAVAWYADTVATEATELERLIEEQKQDMASDKNFIENAPIREIQFLTDYADKWERLDPETAERIYSVLEANDYSRRKENTERYARIRSLAQELGFDAEYYNNLEDDETAALDQKYSTAPATEREVKRSFEMISDRIKKVFSGSKIENLSNDWLKVTTKSGDVYMIDVADAIAVSEAEMNKARKASGLKGDVEIQGRYLPVNGDVITGILSISKYSENGTEVHEATHAAIANSLTQKQVDALYKRAEQAIKEHGLKANAEEVVCNSVQAFVLARENGWATTFTKAERDNLNKTPWGKMILNLNRMGRKGQLFSKLNKERLSKTAWGRAILAKYEMQSGLGKLFAKVYDFVKAMQSVFSSVDNFHNVARRIENGTVWKQRVGLVKDAEAKYHIVGEHSRTMSREIFDLANKMEKEGKTREQIYDATGMWRAEDGDWRYEIAPRPDKMDLDKLKRVKKIDKTSSRENGDYINLGDFYDNPELYAAYPELADTKVYVVNSDTYGDGYLAATTIRDGAILVASKHLSDSEATNKDYHLNPKGTLVHEIQHLIQNIEGFSQGADIENSYELLNDTVHEAPLRIKDCYRQIDKRLPKLMDSYNRARKAEKKEALQKEIDQIINDYKKEHGDGKESILGEIKRLQRIGEAAEKAYGEIKANRKEFIDTAKAHWWDDDNANTRMVENYYEIWDWANHNADEETYFRSLGEREAGAASQRAMGYASKYPWEDYTSGAIQIGGEKYNGTSPIIAIFDWRYHKNSSGDFEDVMYKVDSTYKSRKYENKRHEGEVHKTKQSKLASTIHRADEKEVPWYRKIWTKEGRQELKDNFRVNWIDRNHYLSYFDKVLSSAMGIAYDRENPNNIRNKLQYAQNHAMGMANALIMGDDESIKMLAERYKIKNKNILHSIAQMFNLAQKDKEVAEYVQKYHPDKWGKSAEERGNAIGEAIAVRLVAMQNIEMCNNIDAENKAAEAKWVKDGKKGAKPKPIEYTISGGMSKDDCLEIIRQSKPLEKYTNMFYEVNDAVLDILVDSGLIRPITREILRTKYKYYCPLIRDMSDTAALDAFLNNVGTGKGMGNVSDPLKLRKKEGSSRDVIDPIEAVVQSIGNVMTRAELNMAGQAFVDSAEKYGLKDWVARVKGHTSDPQNCIFTVMKDGKNVAYQTTPALYSTIVGAYAPAVDFQAKVLTVPAKVLRAGATLSPSFIVRNFLRDTVMASIASKYGFKPVYDSLRGAYMLWSDPKFRAEFESEGIVMSQLVSSRTEANKTRSELVSGTGWDKWKPCTPMDVIKAIGKYPIPFLSYLSENVEKSTRAGLFLRAKEKGASRAEAGHTATEDTLNFGRMGILGQKANQIIPFFNACLQGGDKMYQMLANDPVGTLTRISKYIIAPSVMLWALNHDEPWYKELDPHIKAQCWVMPNGIRIPKPQEAGVLFGTGIEVMLQAAYEQDPKGMNEWLKQLQDNFIPNFLPTTVLPIFEWISNYNTYSGRPIENAHMQKLPEAERYGDYTSTTSIVLGRALNLSPVKLDNTIRDLFGTLGMFVAQMPDALVPEKQNLPDKKFREMPIIRDFLINDMNMTRTLSDFYELKEAADRWHYTKGVKGKPHEYISSINKANTLINEKRTEIRDISNKEGLNPIVKRAMIDKIRAEQRRIARIALDKYGKYFMGS